MRSIVRTVKNEKFKLIDNKIHNLNLNNEHIPFRFKVDKRLKGVKLFFNEGLLNIHSPQKLTLSILNQILNSYSNSILKDWKSIQLKSKDINNNIEGKELSFRGRILKLKLNTSVKTKINIWNSLQELYIEIPKDYDIASNHGLIWNKIYNWYKTESEKFLKERLNYFAPKIGVTYNKVRFKRQRSRWGSCSNKGNINFNWLIIMAPDEIIDYIVIHELCHLKHMNHSVDFWNLVKKFQDNYIASRLWLKKNGHSINFPMA